MTDAPLRVGVLTDGSLRQWQVQALERMVEAGSRIETVIINQDNSPGIYHNLREAPAYLLIAGIRELSIRLFGSYPYLQRVSLPDIEILGDADRVHCDPVSRSDFGQELPNSIVAGYCSDLDFVVRFGFGIVRGSILDAPKYGVFSYHHGDLREYRGRPAGFWEFLENANTIGVTLQQLTDTLDAGGVIQIKQFRIMADDTYQDILRMVYRGSVNMLSEAVSSIQAGKFCPVEPSSKGSLYTAPGWIASLRYGWKNIRRRQATRF